MCSRVIKQITFCCHLLIPFRRELKYHCVHKYNPSQNSWCHRVPMEPPGKEATQNTKNYIKVTEGAKTGENFLRIKRNGQLMLQPYVFNYHGIQKKVKQYNRLLSTNLYSIRSA